VSMQEMTVEVLRVSDVVQVGVAYLEVVIEA